MYDALCEPDADKRSTAIETWINRASEKIAPYIREELAAYIAWIMKGRETEEGWKRGERKWRSIQPQYHLVMDIKLRTVGLKEQSQLNIVDPLEAIVPGPDRNTRNTLLKESTVREMARQKTAGSEGKSWDDGDYDGESDRSPNDDRSDSMNPNNDTYQAAMDNHANQMNPNNDAYWSSRGR